MKKNKHILLNITEDQYNALVLMAAKNKRNITNMAYILLDDAIENNIINYIDEKSGGFNKLLFDPCNRQLK